MVTPATIASAVVRNEKLPNMKSPPLVAVGQIFWSGKTPLLPFGVAKGVFRSVDPLDLYISNSALGFTYVSNRLKTMAGMILRYLAPDGHQDLAAIDR
jgi:hypothetical protein